MLQFNHRKATTATQFLIKHNNNEMSIVYDIIACMSDDLPVFQLIFCYVNHLRYISKGIPKDNFRIFAFITGIYKKTC